MNEYNDYYEKKLKEGNEYQDFVVDQLYNIGFPITLYTSKKYQRDKGENRNGIEIKLDDKYKKTNNLYIELYEKSNNTNKLYVQSGINREDNTILYVIGNYDTIFIFSKTMLRIVKDNGYKIVENKTQTSKGYLLPDDDARKYAITIVENNNERVDEWMK